MFDLNPVISKALVVTETLGLNPSFLQGHRPRRGPGSNSGQMSSCSLSGRPGHSTTWPQWRHSPWTTRWPQVVTHTLDIPVALVARRVTDVNRTSTVADPEMAVGSIPGPDVTLVLGGKQATDIGPFLTALDSAELPLTTAPEPFCLFLSDFTTMYLHIILTPNHQVPCVAGQAHGCIRQAGP